MTNVFEDLLLNKVGDPLEDGAFHFEKGSSKSFHYKNLSGGEKSAFDLLLDLIIKLQYYNDTVFLIDEPESHMHTRLQGKLVKELYNLTPNNSQLWLTTHSLGVTGWAGVEDSLDEQGRIRKTTLDFGGESCDKISVLTKEQKEIIEKLGFVDALF
ncbi:MAG: AAA family ATPase [Euryarchaeota archaeon]|nr:AAA family ATPase [Euryarchaeota archaeon]